jgi:hypothetical protein
MHRLVIALVTLLGLTGVAVVAGYLFLFAAGTDRAAALAPANSAFYVNVYLQPSTGQQMNLSRLIGRLPGFADDASLDEKVDQVVQNLLAGSGVDYRGDVKPWLGNQVAVAGWPSGEGIGDAVPVLIADVKDLEAARASIQELIADGGAAFTAETYEGVELNVSDETTYAFVEEMLVAGPSADGVRAVVDVANGGESLAQQRAFTETMARLEPDHLAAMFVDVPAVSEAAGAPEATEAVGTAGAVLVAEAEGLRLSGSVPFDEQAAGPSDRAGFVMGREPSGLSDWMPEGTIAEVVIFGLRQTLEDAETAISSTEEGAEVASTLDTLRALAAFGLGIDLDAEVLPLLDREVGLAITGFDGELPSGQLFLRPSDPQAAVAALDRIGERLGAVGATVRTETVGELEVTVLGLPDAGEVAYAATDGIIVVGLTIDDVEAAVSAHDSGRTLAASDAYARTFEVAGERAGNEAFVDVGALVDLMGGAADLPADTRDILGQIGGVGFTAPSRDDQIEFHLVLTVDP